MQSLCESIKPETAQPIGVVIRKKLSNPQRAEIGTSRVGMTGGLSEVKQFPTAILRSLNEVMRGQRVRFQYNPEERVKQHSVSSEREDPGETIVEWSDI